MSGTGSAPTNGSAGASRPGRRMPRTTPDHGGGAATAHGTPTAAPPGPAPTGGVTGEVRQTVWAQATAGTPSDSGTTPGHNAAAGPAGPRGQGGADDPGPIEPPDGTGPASEAAPGGAPGAEPVPVDLGLFEAVAAAAVLLDAQGRIAALNSRAEELLGYPAAALLGQDVHDALHRDRHGDGVPRSRCSLLRAVLAGQVAQSGAEWFARADGSVLPVSWLVTPYTVGPRADEDTTDEGAADESAGDGDGEGTGHGGVDGALVVFHVPEGEPATTGAEGAEAMSELDRLALLAETTTRLNSTLEVDRTLRSLVELVLPRLADWTVIDLLAERDEVWRTAVVEYRDGVLEYKEDLQGPIPPVPQESPMPLSRALRGAASTLATPDTYHGPPDSGLAVEQRRLFEATGIHSAAIAPIRGPRSVLGAITLGRAKQTRPFTPADLALLDDIARRAGIALDNARLYQRQRRVAETMQRHLLPQLPGVPGLDMTARYVPAPHASHVGGDWYDAFTLDDTTTALAIGDVVGHDLDAAAGMAQLRNMLRAYAWSHRETPGAIVARLDQAVRHLTDVTMATAVFARVHRGDDGRWRIEWSNAGHPPPLLVHHNGRAEFLEGGHGMLLGTGMDTVRPDAALVLPPRSTLVLYTDGLVESPHRSIDDGLTRLRQHAAALAHRPLGPFCDQLLDRVRPSDNDDDVALLALRTPEA